MSYLALALTWLNDPLNWSGPDGVVALTVEHLTMSFLAVLLAAVVALPIGIGLGHSGRAARVGTATVMTTNVSRALPTFALLTIFASTGIGFGDRPTVLAAASSRCRWSSRPRTPGSAGSTWTSGTPRVGWECPADGS